jgi:hypothetical protein
MALGSHRRDQRLLPHIGAENAFRHLLKKRFALAPTQIAFSWPDDRSERVPFPRRGITFFRRMAKNSPGGL